MVTILSSVKAGHSGGGVQRAPEARHGTLLSAPRGVTLSMSRARVAAAALCAAPARRSDRSRGPPLRRPTSAWIPDRKRPHPRSDLRRAERPTPRGSGTSPAYWMSCPPPSRLAKFRHSQTPEGHGDLDRGRYWYPELLDHVLKLLVNLFVGEDSGTEADPTAESQQYTERIVRSLALIAAKVLHRVQGRFS